MTTNRNNNDRFLVDKRMGHYYHRAGCVATTNFPAVYTELSYAEIKKLKNASGDPFQPHDCVRASQRRSGARRV